MTIK
ncbi:hypothetical protein LSH36_1032g00042 [Paralvinella palmiformis]|jgi:hypothetical protein